MTKAKQAPAQASNEQVSDAALGLLTKTAHSAKAMMGAIETSSIALNELANRGLVAAISGTLNTRAAVKKQHGLTDVQLNALIAASRHNALN